MLVPIESAYATSYWLSIVTLVLSCPVSEILQGFLFRTATPPLFHPNFWGIPLRLGCRCCGSAERRSEANSCNYFRTSPSYMLTVPQRHRQTDSQTDGRLTIAIPRFALRASGGKKLYAQSIDYRLSHTEVLSFTPSPTHQRRC